MDTSLSKALIMVAGVLVAMVVIAFMTHSFNQMGDWATTKDEELLIEQNQEFNKEYEVYDKDLMYGVDVISCLNKALSNNKKITDKRVVNGEQYDASYEVKVDVIINKTLTEGIRIYHMNASGKEIEYTGDENPKDDLKNIDEIFKISTEYKESGISQLGLNRTLKHGYEDTKVKKGTYSLTVNTSSTDTIIALLTLSNDLKQTVKNNSQNATKTTSWTKAVWETPLYDLKTRKFKCSKLTYSESGRVNYIEFKEI